MIVWLVMNLILNKMIKLINLLSEILKINNLNLGDKYISANDLSKKLESNPKEIYDFGG